MRKGQRIKGSIAQAAKTYREQDRIARATVARIELLLNQFEKQTIRAGRMDWAVVGTMAHVAEDLLEIEKDLQSAVENTRMPGSGSNRQRTR